ncbi:MAG: C-terminal helicase domain-containing protein, partial [Bdellovibrionales bacterium]|nr:C-terminal helicase domain-containing protein [Bdellovibrionales bacterium]
TIKIVIATDVAARGLDVKGLTHVVNMSIPREDESYVHRIGRTGRAGLEGIALSFVWPKRIGILRQLERKLGIKMEHVQVPEPGDIARVVLGREIKALFAKPLEYVEGNPIHKSISELISEAQPMDAEVLPWVSALAAKILESKNPGMLNRRTIKSLRADMAPSGGGSYGGSYGGRDGGRRPGGFGGRRPGGFAGRDEGGRGGGMRGPRSGGGRFERPERRDRYAGEGRPEGRPEGRIEPRAAGPRADGPAPRIERAKSRPASDGPRLRDRRDDATGGGAPPKRRGGWEKRERN